MTGNQFDKHREAFIAQLPMEHLGRPVNCYCACNIHGDRSSWLWDEISFSYTDAPGSLDQAKGFARNMINQGMHFAFMLSMLNGESEVWLTTWEDPDRGPVWPVGCEVVVQVVFEPLSD